MVYGPTTVQDTTWCPPTVLIKGKQLMADHGPCTLYALLEQ
jgi:hypothetical protein